jgi:hypothetical protein
VALIGLHALNLAHSYNIQGLQKVLEMGPITTIMNWGCLKFLIQ